ncbi:VOC family protein [Streptomyces sp. NPDC002742]|uniref:VOC family protein n=1 Tax=Streptomyces sp. NPDC002742 TaxID=3364663 RepID=UPI0036AE4EEE
MLQAAARQFKVSDILGGMVDKTAEQMAQELITESAPVAVDRDALSRFAADVARSAAEAPPTAQAVNTLVEKYNASLSYVPGTPCWIELVAEGQQAALELYRDLFGWQGEVDPTEADGYAMCTLNGKRVAGIASPPDEGGVSTLPTPWITYLSTNDADATMKAIEQAGGTVILPVIDVSTDGRMLIASDPTGAVFGVWQPLDFLGAEVVNQSGALTWSELHTSDIEAAKAFYSAVFGVEFTPEADGQDYWTINAGGRTVGGATTLENDPLAMPPQWLPHFEVDDIDQVVDLLVKRGGTVLMSPVDTAVGRVSMVQDPQGATFAVIKTEPAS